MPVTKLHLGCGKRYRQGYINVDVEKTCKADIYHDLDIFPYPFESKSAEKIISFHVIEHLEHPMKFLQECHRILKPNGVLIIECPIGGTWASYHFNHKRYLTPYSFQILEQGSKWAFQFPFRYKIKWMSIYMPFIEERIPFPWRLIYLNCFINNLFTKMRVTLVKVRDFS